MAGWRDWRQGGGWKWNPGGRGCSFRCWGWSSGTEMRGWGRERQGQVGESMGTGYGGEALLGAPTAPVTSVIHVCSHSVNPSACGAPGSLEALGTFAKPFSLSLPLPCPSTPLEKSDSCPSWVWGSPTPTPMMPCAAFRTAASPSSSQRAGLTVSRSQRCSAQGLWPGWYRA